jgi:hypothetical protein
LLGSHQFFPKYEEKVSKKESKYSQESKKIIARILFPYLGKFFIMSMEFDKNVSD